jgi:hypothetical protein
VQTAAHIHDFAALHEPTEILNGLQMFTGIIEKALLLPEKEAAKS